jgi:hypothetical protein
MTELKKNDKVTRKTGTIVQRRTLIITLHHDCFEMRQLGLRTSFYGSYLDLFTYLAKKAADRAVAEKKAARKATKEGRSKK